MVVVLSESDKQVTRDQYKFSPSLSLSCESHNTLIAQDGQEIIPLSLSLSLASYEVNYD